MVFGGVDWIGLSQNKDKWRALVNAVMNLWVPKNAGKLSSGYTTGALSSSAQPPRVTDLLFIRLFGKKIIQPRMSGYYDFRQEKICLQWYKYEYSL
jgi:hypothetical protein